MTFQEKKQATAYILLQFAEWYKEEYKTIDINDLSILKSLKLFFLLSTINLDKDGENLIDLGFSKYIAMPFGPVESDVYDFFKEENYINKSKLDYNVLKLEDTSNLDNDYKSIINNCLKELKSINKNIIKLSASLLVDLTHKYSSWIISYNYAIMNNMSTKEMSNDIIKTEEKFYFI
ncbi:type II toxin-antitoxin system antitoxin SocA domain-containing protein [Chryseobacterium sp. EO14]|uniref:type II toxin-antitoxin system antitoxin SocA domain-containing protein n=1 Tax=Chryseobacterium sp. EO14 TaxID=2950551 RepID=UPI00210A06FC|nr:type II toxin-antitoxin system antitoxin SocA domain-containing protein [Chryseobacterium sp. EO14]MCQ4140423.1 DUF4065 domain-containing protein [Chryseobacterium sp. EO14]